MDNTNTYDFFAVPEGYSVATDSFGNTRIIEHNPLHAQSTAEVASYSAQDKTRIPEKDSASQKNRREKKGLFTGKKKRNKRKSDINRPIKKRLSAKESVTSVSSSAPFLNPASKKVMPRGYNQKLNAQSSSRLNRIPTDPHNFSDQNIYQKSQYGNVNKSISGNNPVKQTASQKNATSAERTSHVPTRTPPLNSNTRPKVGVSKKTSGKSEKNHSKTPKKVDSNVLYEIPGRQNPQTRHVGRFRNNYPHGKSNSNTASAKAQHFRLKAKRKAMISRFLGKFMIFIVFFVLIFALSCGIFYINLKFSSKANITPYTLIINSQTEDKESYELSMDKFYINGGLYLDMSMISDVFDMTTTGNINSLRYVNTSNSDELRVTVGSSVVTMNNVSVSLSNPVIRREESILIPIEFFSNYIEGITLRVETDENKGTRMIYLDQVIEGYDSSVLYGNRAVYAPISFALKDPSAANNIPENSLPTDILYETDPLRLAEEAIKAAEEAKKAAADNSTATE